MERPLSMRVKNETNHKLLADFNLPALNYKAFKIIWMGLAKEVFDGIGKSDETRLEFVFRVFQDRV